MKWEPKMNWIILKEVRINTKGMLFSIFWSLQTCKIVLYNFYLIESPSFERTTVLKDEKYLNKDGFTSVVLYRLETAFSLQNQPISYHAI